MNTNPVDELPLLELFTRLREAGLPLGINEYQLVLRSLQAGFGVRDREALAKLCRTLWIKSPEEERLFNHHFEQIIDFPTLLPSLPSKELPKKELQITQNLLLSLLFNRRILACGAIGIFLLIASSFYFRNQPKNKDQTSHVTVNVNPMPGVISPSPTVLPSSTPSTPPTVKATQSNAMGSRTALLMAIFSIFVVCALTLVTAMFVTKRRKQHPISEIRASAKAATTTNSNKLST
ncbi:MAG: hypothetical protein LH702_23110, partial [Phormidesmis sp. CAN_BIN44]|nr:hypothetical protein [Phormidesmis sp. CAN_BIN44]